MSTPPGPPGETSAPDRRVPLRQAGTFFVFTLAGALAAAVFAGNPGLTWGYVGAFTLAITIGIGMALRADQHNRMLERRRRTP